jgi:hypothetical protein
LVLILEHHQLYNGTLFFIVTVLVIGYCQPMSDASVTAIKFRTRPTNELPWISQTLPSGCGSHEHQTTRVLKIILYRDYLKGNCPFRMRCGFFASMVELHVSHSHHTPLGKEPPCPWAGRLQQNEFH